MENMYVTALKLKMSSKNKSPISSFTELCLVGVVLIDADR
jgi:hypothetical protein